MYKMENDPFHKLHVYSEMLLRCAIRCGIICGIGLLIWRMYNAYC